MDHHTTYYTRLETITFHRTIKQHHTTKQLENDGKIPKSFDTAVWILFWVLALNRRSHTHADYSTVIFYLLFGHPTTNFGSLSRGEPHSPSVNHCVSIILCLRGHWQPHSNVFKNLGWIAKRPTDPQSDWDLVNWWIQKK